MKTFSEISQWYHWCYSASCGGQDIIEDHCNLEESNDKEYSDEDFDIIDWTLLQCLLLQLIKILQISFQITISISNVQ